MILREREEVYCVEHNGDCWQSVFPSDQAELSQLHVTVDDAISYMTKERGISIDVIEVRK